MRAVMNRVPVAVGRGVLALRPESVIDGYGLLHEIRSRGSELVAAAQGSAGRELSRRAFGATRVQWPPQEFGTAKDGRLFTNERGGLVGSSTYWRVWRDAREYALSPDLQASILGGRPYDLRHTCITTWLNAGVPVAEVARRVGNSPEVIHRVYEGCIYGQEEAMNLKIEKELNWLEV
ncbi:MULTISPECIES: hypothetical protein [unclassified Streptomyces]|uniref:hypothetical protein n=1 Tax=unclassified Streptomyces TaxID=2593676 RepID=UPI003865DEC4